MRTILALSIALAVAIVASFWLRESGTQQTSNTAKPASVASTNPHTSSSTDHQHAATSRVPAYQHSVQSLAMLPPTMRPELFEGNVRRAYQVALDIPKTLAQLPCYCHCDRGQGHKSLHSCFIDEHGANCGICINEALMAYSLHKKQNLKVDQIREQIIKSFGVSTSQ